MYKKTGTQRIAVLGLGKLGGILLRAFFEKGLFDPALSVGTVSHADKTERLAEEHGIEVHTDNLSAVAGADVVLLCVKPHQVGMVCEQIAPNIGKDQLLVSVAASVPTTFIEDALGKEVPVVRTMPNTPAEVGCAMTAVCGGKFVSSDHLDFALQMFDAIGRSVKVDEKHMNAVTGLSASGPAFIYIILESLAEAGVKVGLPRDISTLLAAQTAYGASRVVLETGDHPALLKDTVTTPAGCTIDGILELEEGKLRVTLIKAVVKATERAGELLICD
jgi:pyrroline-5-carboxylate reductase